MFVAGRRACQYFMPFKYLQRLQMTLLRDWFAVSLSGGKKYGLVKSSRKCERVTVFFLFNFNIRGVFYNYFFNGIHFSHIRYFNFCTVLVL